MSTRGCREALGKDISLRRHVLLWVLKRARQDPSEQGLVTVSETLGSSNLARRGDDFADELQTGPTWVPNEMMWLQHKDPEKLVKQAQCARCIFDRAAQKVGLKTGCSAG